MSFARALLQDLYIKEALVEIPRPAEPELDEEGSPVLDDDGNAVMVDQDPIVFYARKMNPLQQESAARRASAAQIHMRRLVFRPDDPDYSIMESAVDEIEDLSMFVARVESNNDTDKMQQELSEEDEWAKDNYYQSLIDAWTPKMKRDWTENTEEERDPESKRIWAELKRFDDILEDKMKSRRTNRAAEVEAKPEEEQRKLVFKILLEQQCNGEWMRVFNLWRQIYGIVDKNKDRVFEDEDDAMSSPIEAQRIFRQALDRITLSVTDVKS